MTVQLSVDDALKTTANLRGELQAEIARLQAIIRSADQTIQRARHAIVQLSLQEDRRYALEMDLADEPLPLRSNG